MVNIKINITNKAFYILILIFVVAVGVGVYAYNSGSTPSVFGHSGEEIEIALTDGSTHTLNDYINNILPTQTGGWPAGSYCIIEAQNQQCPAGFTITSPSYNQGAGWEFVLGAGLPLQPGPIQSSNGVHNVDGGDAKFALIGGQVWAFCCK